jgi:hypothetical protein
MHMTEIPGIIVPADPALTEVLDEVGSHEPLMTFPVSSLEDSEEGWSGAFDAMIAAGLFGS